MNEIARILVSYGGLLLFVAGFAEQCGLPFPGAPWCIAAGALSACGKFNLIAAIGWSAAGCVAADAIWYFLGHRAKARVFRLFPHLCAVQVRFDRATLAKLILHGTRMLTVAKFVPFGNFISLHAGALGISLCRFLAVDAFTSVVYAAVYAALGFAFHKQLEQVVAFVQKLGVVSLSLIAILAGIGVIHWLVERHRKKEARPGPEGRKPLRIS